MNQIILILILVLSTLLLVIYEFFGIYNARKKGLTRNVSRMVTHAIMAILLIILLFLIINFAIQYYRLTKILSSL